MQPYKAQIQQRRTDIPSVLSHVKTYTQTHTSHVSHAGQEVLVQPLKPALGHSQYGAFIFSSTHINRQSLCGI